MSWEESLQELTQFKKQKEAEYNKSMEIFEREASKLKPRIEQVVDQFCKAVSWRWSWDRWGQVKPDAIPQYDLTILPKNLLPGLLEYNVYLTIHPWSIHVWGGGPDFKEVDIPINSFTEESLARILKDVFKTIARLQ